MGEVKVGELVSEGVSFFSRSPKSKSNRGGWIEEFRVNPYIWKLMDSMHFGSKNSPIYTSTY